MMRNDTAEAAAMKCNPATKLPVASRGNPGNV